MDWSQLLIPALVAGAVTVVIAVTERIAGRVTRLERQQLTDEQIKALTLAPEQIITIVERYLSNGNKINQAILELKGDIKLLTGMCSQKHLGVEKDINNVADKLRDIENQLRKEATNG